MRTSGAYAPENRGKPEIEFRTTTPGAPRGARLSFAAVDDISRDLELRTEALTRTEQPGRRREENRRLRDAPGPRFGGAESERRAAAAGSRTTRAMYRAVQTDRPRLPMLRPR
jgi:hypothetical protein